LPRFTLSTWIKNKEQKDNDDSSRLNVKRIRGTNNSDSMIIMIDDE